MSEALTGTITSASVFSVLAVVAAGLAVLMEDTRKAMIAFWFGGMCVGALFLDRGAEYLAVVQWIVSTLGVISFFVFSTLFGEYGRPARKSLRGISDLVPAVLTGAAFFAMFVVAWRHPPESFGALGGAPGSLSDTGSDLISVGQALGDRHQIALELAGFLLLVALIGAGIVSRPEGPEKSEDSA